ncbi:helix-turn-helix domain-containing protein [Negativicoccus succinicivorans]|uniref:helix-turn-helix domain-containing protein n=1 Tax=Negativicoccus succinicivorans TaxID=620903 RepID=UPI00290D3DC3|nr:helix-turn-helix domain-containing protein [Negativicoccus succinicivorans]MDU5530530.1 XRE family transcriptional regulator [Negativicoccus succinicivorans]
MAKGYNKLKAFLVEMGISQKDFADELNISRNAANRKLNQNGLDFSLREMRHICTRYNLDANRFFLTK